jgi:hypothetical protein
MPRAVPADLRRRAPSRRRALAGGLGLIAGLALAGAAGRVLAAKAPQAAVQYQPAPRGDERCAVCRNYDAAAGTCARVADPIRPDGWCALFTRA